MYNMPLFNVRTTMAMIAVAILTIVLTSTISVAAAPAIEFTYVPPIGSFDNLQGKVTNVNPSEYKVAVYIYVSGWWTKPYFISPLQTINSDGNWTCDITTGRSDEFATKVKAYLLRNGDIPPSMSGGQIFPAELEAKAVASTEVSRRPDRIIDFSGRKWIVKYSAIPEGPGLNYFSDSDQSVFVDNQGQLHLKIIKAGDKWYSSEVILNESLGYGEYIFYLANRADQIDKNAVLGMFTWDTLAPSNNYREMDIELSKWGKDVNDNSQFVVRPWTHPGNIFRFNANFTGNYSVHSFNWSSVNISFKSLRGWNISSLNISDKINSWTYTGSDIPPPGKENARINLWLFDPNNVLGKPPSDGKEVEVIIKKFEFISLKGDINGNGKVTLVDAIYLAKHVGGFIGYETIYANGDINCDGKVTLVDAIYLAKHVGGFIGYEKIC
ncbi:Uncharacterised protein [uncultured archaeon]|nr:Uncharacterised protein [uncultured archaeon]